MSVVLSQLEDHKLWFPDPASALEEPNGLLAIGGDLRPERLLLAYQNGIFPWHGPHHPILWWSPDPRCLLDPTEFHISKSLRKRIKQRDFTITLNYDFNQVVEGCAAPRLDTDETWINAALKHSYAILHQQGLAHSVEVWMDGVLTGGLYGIALGQIFCGESMFSMQSNCSKLALLALCQHFSKHGGKMIDCQMQTSHLGSLGAKEWPRDQFLVMLRQLQTQPVSAPCWQPQRIEI